MQTQVPIIKCFHRPNMIKFVKGFHKVSSESFMRTAPMSSKLEQAKLNLTFQGELIFSGKSAHVRWPRAKSAREVTGRERAQKLRLYMSPNLFSRYFLKTPPQKFFEFFPCGTMKARVTKCWPLVSKAQRTCYAFQPLQHDILTTDVIGASISDFQREQIPTPSPPQATSPGHVTNDHVFLPLLVNF